MGWSSKGGKRHCVMMWILRAYVELCGTIVTPVNLRISSCKLCIEAPRYRLHTVGDSAMNRRLLQLPANVGWSDDNLRNRTVRCSVPIIGRHHSSIPWLMYTVFVLAWPQVRHFVSILLLFPCIISIEHRKIPRVRYISHNELWSISWSGSFGLRRK